MKRRKEVFFLVVFFVVMACGLPQASMIKMDLQELVNMSNMVVKGTVNSKISSWTEDHEAIYTEVLLTNVEQITKTGYTPLLPLSVRIYGGEVENIGLVVSDQPEFEIGQEVIVFVKEFTTGDLGTNYKGVTGGYQGKYTIVNEKIKELEEPVVKDKKAPVDEVGNQFRKGNKRLNVKLETFIQKIREYL